ncbi:maleamate amidohydrolase [Novosphingobium kunmingense]|uniref:Maleamate amidohydrolase n=1 Tax=Novosphingobium kunmingense TaxID=1211806 RepID=A0A2N0H3F1_9SPHN|nr:isochorismatase family protein [Novosphingobium kunmingense]PKB13461.1 maleamate amidohydrolase [Novosphingobium kunmingense]
MAGDRSDLTENYRVFNAHLPAPKRPALLIIDVAMAYLDPASPLYAGVEGALSSCKRLVAAAREAGVPVIFTNVEYEPGGLDGGVFYRKIPVLRVFDRGSPLGAFPPSLLPKEGELVITKQYASAFFGTQLAANLNAMGIDGLLIGGFSTSGCVRATTVDACQNGFLPFVVSDACGDRHEEPHRANLFDMQAKYAEVVDGETALSIIAATRRREMTA